MKLKHGRNQQGDHITRNVMFFPRPVSADECFPRLICIPITHIAVGDTLSEKDGVRFTGLTRLWPQILRRVRLSNTSKDQTIALRGLRDLPKKVCPGHILFGVPMIACRVSANWTHGFTNPWICRISLERAPFSTARWVSSDDKPALKSATSTRPPSPNEWRPSPNRQTNGKLDRVTNIPDFVSSKNSGIG